MLEPRSGVDYRSLNENRVSKKGYERFLQTAHLMVGRLEQSFLLKLKEITMTQEETKMLEAITKVIDLDEGLDLLDGETFMKLVQVKEELQTK
nr:hypothetical protein [uncultured Mediterranean phage uvMED]